MLEKLLTLEHSENLSVGLMRSFHGDQTEPLSTPLSCEMLAVVRIFQLLACSFDVHALTVAGD